MLPRLIDKLGHRGAWLVLMGSVWCVFGVGAFVNATDGGGRSWALVEYLPPLVQALGWWITGIVAVGVGLRTRLDDSAGHVALYLMPAAKLMSFTVSSLVYFGTLVIHAYDPAAQVQGWSAAWYAVLVWSMIAVMLGLVAAWPNPTPPLPEPPCATEPAA